MPLFRWNSYTFLKKCINWTVLSLSHMHSHTPSPTSAAAPGPGEGEGRGMKPQNETPRLHLALYCLRLSGMDLEQKGCQVQLQHRCISGLSRPPERKKIPQKRRKPCWSAIAKLTCMAQSWDQTLRTVTWWLSCCFLKDVQPTQLPWGIGRNLCFGAASNLKPGIVLCIQPTHSETFAPPCGASGTHWTPARNLLPPRTTSFSGANLCKTSKGAFYQKLFTFSISPQHLQETAGGRSTLTQF